MKTLTFLTRGLPLLMFSIAFMFQVKVVKSELLNSNFQEVVTLKGVVKDPEGNPLIAASIQVKGTSLGTTTDINGRFSIPNVKLPVVLQVNYLGFEMLEVDATPESMEIILKESSVRIDDLVVNAFGVRRKESVVGSIQSVKPDELRVASSSLSNSFAGRIAGVVAVQRSGEPGADASSFWIRGISTFAGPTSPLIFIDDVEVSVADMNALPPEVIENFSILKDATATALYGARGANGVVVIRTRMGKDNQKVNINLRLENHFAAPIQIVKMADGVDYMNLLNEAILTRNPNAQPRFSQEKIDNTINNVDPIVFPNVDWMDYLFKKYTIQQAMNFNMSGGGSRVNYFLSASINNDNGMLKKDPLNKYDNNIRQLRYSFQGNIGARITPSTKVTLRLNTQIVDYSGTSVSTGDIYNGIFRSPPVLFPPVYPSPPGSDHIFFGNQSGGPLSSGQGANIYLNPYAQMVRGFTNRNSSTSISTFEVEQDLGMLTKGLKISALASFKGFATSTITRQFSPFYYSLKSYEKQSDGSYAYDLEAITRGTTALSTSAGNGGDRLFNLQAKVDYTRTFEKHEVGGMLLYLQRDYNLNNPSTFFATLPVRNQGFAGRFTYSYDNKYLMETNFGYNGSENFAAGRRFGFFPSIAAGYIVSNEKFFKPLISKISFLKIRASYGIVGNSFTDPRFPYISFVNLNGRGYTFGDNWQTSASGVVITKYGTESAEWEKGEKVNIGLDITLFEKLALVVDVFNEVRSGIFMQRRVIPAESGIVGSLPFSNLGKVRNEGIDVTLDYNERLGRNIDLSIRGTFTFNRNTLLERNEPQLPHEYLSEIGKPLNRHFGLVALGLFKDQADIDNSPEQTYTPNLKPGDIKYADLNGDGRIDDLDRKQMGFPTVPQIVYGFGASLRVNKMDFSFLFQGIARTSLMMNNIHPFNSDQTSLFDFIAKDYWSEANPNPNAKYPRLVSNLNDHNNFKSSTYWLRDGSFLRLKNVEIGYTYKFVRLYISAQNALTFSPFRNWDPEQGGGNGLGYPPQKLLSAGAQFSF